MAIIDAYVALIKKYAQENALEPSLVAAICMQESGFQPGRVRYEAAWSYFVFPLHYAKLLRITNDTEIQLQKFSYSLMQVMGSVARELGYDDSLLMLAANPDLGIKYGCKKLASLSTLFPDSLDRISAYNSGNAKKNPDGTYINKGYVQNVLEYQKAYAYLDQ